MGNYAEIIEFLTSLSETISGGGEDRKIIIVLVSFITIVWGPSIVKYVATIRERKQHKKLVDKAILGWIKNGKKERTYIDMLLHQYLVWAFICFVCVMIHADFYKVIGNLWAHIISKGMHILFSCIYGIYLWKNEKFRESIAFNKRYRIILAVYTYMVFFIPMYWMTLVDSWNLPNGIFGLTLVIWTILIFREWESKYVYENQYVTINTKEFGTIENVQAWKIKCLNGWVGLSVYENGEVIEKRVKREDISGVTYYGKPIITISNFRFFNSYKESIEVQKK